MPNHKKVTIREVCLRDGLQSIRQFVPTETKAAILSAVYEAGARTIETTSFVSPKAIPQLGDAADLLKMCNQPGIIHEVMVPNLKGAQMAVAAKVNKMIVFMSATEAHNKANIHRTINESLEDLKPIYKLSAEHNIPVCGAIAVSFGCPYQGKVTMEDVYNIAKHFVDEGCKRITLGDTTGMATPVQISKTVEYLFNKLPNIDFCLHLHNNRGTAMANLYAAFLSGLLIFDTSLGGIGGCPNVPQAAGNLATEDVVFMFDEMGVQTGIDLKKIIKAAKYLEEVLGFTLPGQVMKSGPNDPQAAYEICGIK